MSSLVISVSIRYCATYINPAFTANVDPTKTYQVKLRNQSADSGSPDLTALIAFP